MHPYIIGETAYHHQGDFEYLQRMTGDIADIKLNAVKYHLLLKTADYMQRSHPLFEATMNSTFSKQQWEEIFAYAKKLGLDIIALCDDFASIEYINKEHCGIFAVELHASSLNDYYLLKQAAEFTNLIILGIGGSSIDEINHAVTFLKEHGKKDILLMFGFQAYPTHYSTLNLSKMLKLQSMFDLPVGYADHTRFDDPNNIYISTMAAAMGINILEKHYTPEPGVERIDYHAAVGKEDMLKIKELMKLYISAYGNGTLSMSEPEAKYGITGPMKKAIVARKRITKGEALTLGNLWFKRTREQSTLRQTQFAGLIGLSATRDIEEDEIIDYTKVDYPTGKATSFDLTGGVEV